MKALNYEELKVHAFVGMILFVALALAFFILSNNMIAYEHSPQLSGIPVSEVNMFNEGIIGYIMLGAIGAVAVGWCKMLFWAHDVTKTLRDMEVKGEWQ